MQIKIKGYNWEILSFTRFLLAFIVMAGHLAEFADIGFLSWYTLLGSFEAIFGFLLISGLSIGNQLLKIKARTLNGEPKEFTLYTWPV
jgi:hypothetical protein